MISAGWRQAIEAKLEAPSHPTRAAHVLISPRFVSAPLAHPVQLEKIERPDAQLSRLETC